MDASMSGLKHALEKIPLVRTAQAQRYERWFSGDCMGQVRGVFANFTEALRSAPKTKPLGFEVPGYAELHLDRMRRILPYDYPVLHWLEPLLRSELRIFDFGGNVGVHYYAYANYLRYRADLRWTVCDLPPLIELGLAIAASEKATALSFTRSFEDARGADVLLAAGVVQYLEGPSFLESTASLGYKVIDAWEVPGLSCLVPFHPERSVATYSGLYLRREG
jgi:hypothetical protein